MDVFALVDVCAMVCHRGSTTSLDNCVVLGTLYIVFIQVFSLFTPGRGTFVTVAKWGQV